MTAPEQYHSSRGNARRPRMRPHSLSSAQHLIGQGARFLEPLTVLCKLLALLAGADKDAFFAQRERYLSIGRHD